jgi:ClpP class serine protease
MAGWGDILEEVKKSAVARQAQGLGPDLDGICLKYISRLHDLSKRAVIVYASGWLAGLPGSLDYSVRGADVHALMENCRGVNERELDLVLHSPGGSPEAAEQMINYLRTQFDYIRAIVPLQAKSAATMIALGCDEIAMGSYSELGPVDPQILVPVPEGQRFAPAHAILRDFQRARDELSANVSALQSFAVVGDS